MTARSRTRTIRQAKRQAKLTNLGLALACLDLFADFCKRAPKILLLILGTTLVLIVALAVEYWPVTALLICLWILWKVRYRILWTYAGARNQWDRYRGKDIPY